MLNGYTEINVTPLELTAILNFRIIKRKTIINSIDLHYYDEAWANVAVDPGKEVQVGYYHIRACDIEEAMAMAKDNPEFEFVPSARIEVRPIKMKEEQTNFVYPTAEHK